MSRVLAFAHETSSLVALAGGTLAKYASLGGERFMAEVVYGASGSSVERDRLGETVAGVFGATWLGCVALDSEDDGRLVRDPVMDVIRRARPDVIIVPDDGNEPKSLADLAFNAAYCSTIPNYISPTGLEAASVRAPILLMDKPFARDYQPDSYVDISEHWDAKVRALELCEEAGASADIRHVAETSSRARGVQVQVEFAEAFRLERVWGRLRPYRLLP